MLDSYIEQRASIKICCKLCKTFTETRQVVSQFYGDNFLFCGKIHKCIRLKNGRDSLNGDQHVGQPESVITKDSVATVQWVINHLSKS